MNTIEELMHQPYYSAELLRQLTDDMGSLMEKYDLTDKSDIHFFVAAAHAYDICVTIQNRGNTDFDMMPMEDIERDIYEAFNHWIFRGLFVQEDEQGNPEMDLNYVSNGAITAVPQKSGIIEEGQKQLVKKQAASSCFTSGICFMISWEINMI